MMPAPGFNPKLNATQKRTDKLAQGAVEYKDVIVRKEFDVDGNVIYDNIKKDTAKNISNEEAAK